MIVDHLVGRLRAAGCVYAEDEAALLVEAAGEDRATLDRLVAAREAGEPLEQLLGWVSFAGLRLAVRPGVFVPRLRTELLAEQAAALIMPGAIAVELCCGVAPVAAVLQHRERVRELYAVDLDPLAIHCARQNVADPAIVLVGDLYAPLPATIRGRVDLIAANAPYVPSSEIALMPREAREHEPRAALDGGVDGTDVQRRIIDEAPSWLRCGGRLLIETGRRQAVDTAAMMRAAGFSASVVADRQREATVVTGRL